MAGLWVQALTAPRISCLTRAPMVVRTWSRCGRGAAGRRRRPDGRSWEKSMATAQRKVEPVVSEADVSGGKAPARDADELLGYYRDMLLIRRFEERAGQLYGMGLIGGFCHLYIGQEAVAVGVQHPLRPRDSVITGYRDHGHMLVTGMDPARVMAELTGRSGGYSKGKGGSMHMFAKDRHFYGGHG